MRYRLVHAATVCWILAAALAFPAQAQVNLSLEPAEMKVSAGAAFSLQLWARSATPTTFDGLEVLLSWDSALVELTGNDDGSAPYAWSSSGFPAASPRNADFSDGDALYQALPPLVGASPQTDLLITTLQFAALQQAGSAAIGMPVSGETEVAGAGVSVLGTTIGATVLIERANGGGSSGGGGDPPADDGDDAEEEGGDGDGALDGQTDPGTGNADNVTPEDTVISGPTDDTGGPNGDGGDAGTEEAADQTVVSPPPFTFCGAGMAEAMVACLAGLSLLGGRRSRRGGA